MHSATVQPKFLLLEQKVLSQLVQYGQMHAPCVGALARAFEGYSTIGQVCPYVPLKVPSEGQRSNSGGGSRRRSVAGRGVGIVEVNWVAW
jgi:hypothetical protein